MEFDPTSLLGERVKDNVKNGVFLASSIDHHPLLTNCKPVSQLVVLLSGLLKPGREERGQEYNLHKLMDCR